MSVYAATRKYTRILGMSLSVRLLPNRKSALACFLHMGNDCNKPELRPIECIIVPQAECIFRHYSTMNSHSY